MGTKTAALKISVVCLLLTNAYVIEASFKRSIWNSRIIGLKRSLDNIDQDSNKKSFGYLFRAWPPRYNKKRNNDRTPPPTTVLDGKQIVRYDLLGYY